MLRTPRRHSTDGRYRTLGGVAVWWMESHLNYGPGDLEGEPYVVDPFLRDFLDDYYVVDMETGRRVVQSGVLSVAKGNSKSEIEAAVNLFELEGFPVLDPETLEPTRRRSVDIPVAAASYEQADLVFGACQKMAERIAGELDIYEKEILRKDGSGRVYKVAAAAGTNDGRRPSSVSIDELHEWTGNKERVYLVLTNGLTKRRDSHELIISTAGDPGISRQLLAKYEYGRRVATGEVDDPSFVMHWYQPTGDVDLSESGDRDNILTAISAANPASWVDPETVIRRLEIDRIPEHEFRRYYLNQWASSASVWLPSGEWESRVDPDRSIDEGERIVLGFDGSYNRDSTALIGCTLDDTHLFTVGVWEKPPDVKNWRVPRSEVDAVIDDAFRRFDVVELACDPARWSMYLDEWIDRYGDDRVIEYPNTSDRMVPATSKFYDAVTGGTLSHDGSPTLSRHVANATVKPKPGGRYVLQKDHPDRKIDAAIAAVMAHDRATWRREEESAEVRVELW